MMMMMMMTMMIMFDAESLRLPIVAEADAPSARSIRLRLDPPPPPPSVNTTGSAASASSLDNDDEEAYTLTVDADRELISATGGSPAAVFYAVQTLVNLAFPDGRLHTLTVRDRPRFHYRGRQSAPAINTQLDRSISQKRAVCLRIYVTAGLRPSGA